MNLFVLSESSVEAANALCNKHVIKMCSETANMLLWPFKNMGIELPYSKLGRPLRLSHQNHPATKWTCESEENYKWSRTHFITMLRSYKDRYGRRHYAENYAEFISRNEHLLAFLNSKQTPFARCFGKFEEQLQSIEDTVSAYRQYYILDKVNFARWPSEESIPDWWQFEKSEFLDSSFVDGVYSKKRLTS